MNTQQLLASIAPQRQLTHEQGKQIFLLWDERCFRLSRAEFSQFVRALEHGTRYLYAEAGAYCVVHVDDEMREIWLGERCVALSSHEYRALLNAALTTETRLHGFRDSGHTPVLPAANPHIAHYYPPRPIRFCWN